MRGDFLIALALPVSLLGQKFFPDDPLWEEPPPYSVGKVKGRKLSEYYDFLHSQFAEPGERHPDNGPPIPSQAVNTIGEAMNGAWYVNRHWLKPMTIDELVRGPGNQSAPAAEGPWKVVAAKNEGVTPGFTMVDAKGRRYFVKFDPRKYPEMASAADVIASKFFHALGYHVPENYAIYFHRNRLVVAPDTKITDSHGKYRAMTDRDIQELLQKAPFDRERGYRAVASLALEGQPIGPFRYHSTRRDDPNDVTPHEHRRDLRGLYVFSAWLGHNDVKSLNSLDTIVEENGRRYIRHHLIDFGASLGSDSFTEKSPRAGNEYLFAWTPSIVQFFTLGLYVPRWARADYPDIPAAGNFEYEVFDPLRWKPNYPIPAFENRLPGDTFWAARQVAAFTDEEIRAVVDTGRFTDPQAAEWLSRCLRERRDRIARAYLGNGLAVDRFRVRNGMLEFDDLAVLRLKSQPVARRVEWSRFDNQTSTGSPLPGETSFRVPAAGGEYLAAAIQPPSGGSGRVTVYVRGRTGVVGVERVF